MSSEFGQRTSTVSKSEASDGIRSIYKDVASLAYTPHDDKDELTTVHDGHSDSREGLVKLRRDQGNVETQLITVKSTTDSSSLYSSTTEGSQDKQFTHYVISESRLKEPVDMDSVDGRTQFFDLSDEENECQGTMIKECNFEEDTISPELKTVDLDGLDKQPLNKTSPSTLPPSPKQVQFDHTQVQTLSQGILSSGSTRVELQGQLLTNVPVSMQVDGPYHVQLNSCHESTVDVQDEDDADQKEVQHNQNGNTSDQGATLFTPTLITFNASATPTHKDVESIDDDTDKEVVNQQWFTTKDDKSTLHYKGMNWRQGMWSREEEKILKSNIEEFCKARGISDATLVIFDTPKDERKDFYRSIAQGIQRPLFAIYRKVLRMYDHKNYVGKYTADEVHRLQELRNKYGNDWAAIGGALGRSASSVKDRCRLLKANKRTGKWTSDEERLLSEAVREQTRTSQGESVTTGITWSAVTERVGTRTEKQCRAKWLNFLNWKEAGGEQWSKADEGELISRIAGFQAEDESHLDWVTLADRWASVRSPQWLRGKWWGLKKKVPNSQFIGFQETVKYLQTTYMESLKMKLDRQCIAISSSNKSPATFRSNALSSLSSQFNRSAAKSVKKLTADVVSTSPVGSTDAGPSVSPRNIVIADAFSTSNSYDTTTPNYVQFQLTTIAPQPFLLHTVQSGTFATSLGEQFVIQPINMAAPLVQSSTDELVTQGSFIVQNVSDHVHENEAENRTVEFSQAMVQTELSIPIPAGEITHNDLERANLESEVTHNGLERANLESEITHNDLERANLESEITHTDLERANLEAIDDEISRNIEPLEDTSDNSSESHLTAHFRLGEPTVVEIQPDEIGEKSVNDDSPGIITITMETVRNVSTNIEDNIRLNGDISELKEI